MSDVQRLGRPGDAGRDQPGLPAPPESPQEAQRRQWAERLERTANHPAEAKRELGDRTHALPPGHPSSAWDDRGNPKPPVPRLADVELSEPPLSDADYADHIAYVETAFNKSLADGLATEQRYTINPDQDIWSDERTGQHNEILRDTYDAAAQVPCDRQAIIAGGLGGAGKSTVLEKHAGIDRSDYLIINPDDFKDQLASRGLVPHVPGLSPMEATALAHKESSHLAKRLALRAMADGKNIIWDITMSSTESTMGRIEDLRSHGYQDITAIFVEIPIEKSVERAASRHRHGHDRYLAGDGLGGRYLPPEVIRSQADAEFGSINRRAFETVKDHVSNWMIYDNSDDAGNPVLVERSP